MTTSKTAVATAFPFPYITCRNISSPEDKAVGRKVYAGHAPASSVLKLEDDENVREYLVDARGKMRRQPTLVHQAIRKTLTDTPDDFSILNGGMVIVARDIELDDEKKKLTLKRPSIINGSQTQGELRRYFEKNSKNEEFFEPSIKFELIVTDDDDLIAEISIARNFQNDVRAISIAGRRGQLDELESAVRKAIPGAQLRKSETDLTADGEFLDTEKLIQVCFALMPAELLEKLDGEREPTNKGFTYSQKTRCLKIFQRIVEHKDEAAECKAAYAYFLDIAGEAWSQYERWKSHEGFRGTRIRSIVRDGREIVEVPDGIIFPILAALSSFVRLTGKKWKLMTPPQFDEKELIEAAAQVYAEIAGHNPQTMGKNKACYSTLIRLTSIYARLAA